MRIWTGSELLQVSGLVMKLKDRPACALAADGRRFLFSECELLLCIGLDCEGADLYERDVVRLGGYSPVEVGVVEFERESFGYVARSVEGHVTAPLWWARGEIVRLGSRYTWRGGERRTGAREGGRGGTE